MAFRKLNDIKNVILKAIIEIGATDGVINVTAKKIAEKCDISTFTVFEYYQTKQNYLDCAAISIDTPRMEEALKMAESQMSFNEIWDKMLDEFVSNPDATLYYISYINTFGFDPTEKNSRSEAFLKVAKAIFERNKALTEHKALLLWDYVTTMIFYYSEKFIHKYLPYDESTKEFVKDLVFNGLSLN